MVRRIAIYALIVLALFGAWLGLIGREYDALEPRGPMLADLLVTLPDPSEVEAFNCRGEAYVVVYGRNELSFRIPSGPPAYMFDGTGRLVSWTPDTGEEDPNWKGGCVPKSDRRYLGQDEVWAWPGARP